VSDPRGRVARLELDLNLLVQGTPTLVDFGAGSLVYTTLRKGESALLRPGQSRWEVLQGPAGDLRPFVLGPQGKDARRAEGWAHVMDRQRCTALAVADFDRDEIQADADGRLRVRRPARELRLWLHFVAMPVQVGALTSPQAMLAPLKVEVRE
jgi:hypothetical protein